ncbi:unnamed protein product [Cylindrotheca closterium]|uniref:Uncharacterized protein n=1 Tax=Cylindrotheca closterium TaxID=2856 RepID=A0AAD2JGG8_9STRA|nr:unnamed protein product [Cylindrotheca closterium]
MRFPSFSAIKSLPTDADYNALLKNGFHGSSSMPDCANAVTSALGLMFFDPQGKLSTVTISKKVILDNGMSAGTFASLRDDLAQAIPVTIDPNELPKRVIGVGNNGRAVSCCVPLLKDTQYHPSNAKNADDADLKTSTSPSNRQPSVRSRFSALLFQYISSFNSKVDALSQAHADVDAEPSVPTGTVRPIDHASIIKEAILASKTTTTNDPASEAQERVLLSWHILFGHFVTHPDGSVEYVLADCRSTAWKTILKAKPQLALRFFHEAFEQSIKGLQPTRNAYHALFDWDVHRVQAAGMAAIQGASFTTRSLVMNQFDALSCFSLLQFLFSDRTDKDLASHINEDEEGCMQEDMGEHVTKRASKKTKLYSKGRCASVADIKSTISNVAQLAAFATDNFSMSNNTPFILELFDTVMVALSLPDAVQWQHVIDLTDVAVHILHDLQTAFQVIASEAKDFTLHAEARPLGTIQRAELFSGARAQTQLLLDKIDEGLQNCRRPNYPRTSALSALISSTKAPDASPSGKQSSESLTSKQDTVTSPAKKPKPSSEESSTRGMLICTSTGRRCPTKKGRSTGGCTNLVLLASRSPPRPGSNRLQTSNGLLGKNYALFISFSLMVDCCYPHQVAAASVSTLTRQVNYYSSCSAPTSHSVDPQDECALQDYAPTRTVFDELDPADMLVAERFRHILEQGARVTPTFTRSEQSQFLRDLQSRTALAVESPYGKDSKDSNDRCFKTESTFRHTFVFLYKSGYLDTTTGDRLGKAFSGALLLCLLLKGHEFVDFRPLRSVLPSDTPMGQVMHCWSRMFTACLLHYNLDVATAVRYVGNIHTGAHCDWNALEPELRAASVDDGLVADLRRVLVDGCPNYVNATSSERNRRSFAKYGNHDLVYTNVKKTQKAVQKDFSRSHSLVGNPLLTSFLPDTQQIPKGLGVVPGKSDRQICDGTFRPLLESIAPNDMTTKDTEHKVEFPKSLWNHLAYIYNARISYKSEELYLGDDDVLGAFRHGKWNPNVIGMHTFSIFGFLFFALV